MTATMGRRVEAVERLGVLARQVPRAAQELRVARVLPVAAARVAPRVARVLPAQPVRRALQVQPVLQAQRALQARATAAVTGPMPVPTPA